MRRRAWSNRFTFLDSRVRHAHFPPHRCTAGRGDSHRLRPHRADLAAGPVDRRQPVLGLAPAHGSARLGQPGRAGRHAPDDAARLVPCAVAERWSAAGTSGAGGGARGRAGVERAGDRGACRRCAGVRPAAARDGPAGCGRPPDPAWPGQHRAAPDQPALRRVLRRRPGALAARPEPRLVPQLEGPARDRSRAALAQRPPRNEGADRGIARGADRADRGRVVGARPAAAGSRQLPECAAARHQRLGGLVCVAALAGATCRCGAGRSHRGAARRSARLGMAAATRHGRRRSGRSRLARWLVRGRCAHRRACRRQRRSTGCCSARSSSLTSSRWPTHSRMRAARQRSHAVLPPCRLPPRARRCRRCFASTCARSRFAERWRRPTNRFARAASRASSACRSPTRRSAAR